MIVCPEGALTIIEREAKEYNDQACKGHEKHLKGIDEKIIDFRLFSTYKPKTRHWHFDSKDHDAKSEISFSNQLANWMIQMRLARHWAPFLKYARHLIAADCIGFAYSYIQRDFIKGRVTLVGCPKLDASLCYSASI